MNTRFLETFLWVARLKSFSAAAQRQHTTQAAISNRIAALERELGVRLFDRDTQAVRITADGEKAMRRAEEIVRITQQLCDQFGDENPLKGTITLGTVDSIVYSWLPTLISKVHASYPFVRIDLDVDTSMMVTRKLLERQVDLALLVGPVVGSHIVNFELGTLETGWFASPKLGLAGRTLDLAEVLAFPVFGYSKGSRPYNSIMQQLEMTGLDEDTVRIFNTNSIATNIKLALDAIGIAMVPRMAVAEYLDREMLVEINVNIIMPPLLFHASYMKKIDSPLPATIASMAGEVASNFEIPTQKSL